MNYQSIKGVQWGGVTYSYYTDLIVMKLGFNAKG